MARILLVVRVPLEHLRLVRIVGAGYGQQSVVEEQLEVPVELELAELLGVLVVRVEAEEPRVADDAVVVAAAVAVVERQVVGHEGQPILGRRVVAVDGELAGPIESLAGHLVELDEVQPGERL